MIDALVSKCLVSTLPYLNNNNGKFCNIKSLRERILGLLFSFAFLFAPSLALFVLPSLESLKRCVGQPDKTHTRVV